MNILLPVLGIMSVTSEWSQRTAMVTFTLEPSRSRFLAAKFVGTLIVAVAAVVIGLALTILANGLYAAFSDNLVTWELGPFRIFCYFLLHVFGMATGFAFGALFLNTAGRDRRLLRLRVHHLQPVRGRCRPDGLVPGHPAVDRLLLRPEPDHRGRRERQGVGPAGDVRPDLAACCRWRSASGGCSGPRSSSGATRPLQGCGMMQPARTADPTAGPTTSSGRSP